MTIIKLYVSIQRHEIKVGILALNNFTKFYLDLVGWL